MSLILSVLEQGMIYAIMALGIYITYKILDFPDLTVDGSFPMGAGSKPAPHTAGFVSGRCGCRRSHRHYPCEAEGKGFTFRYYHDDSLVHRKLKNCGTRQFPHLQLPDDF